MEREAFILSEVLESMEKDFYRDSRDEYEGPEDFIIDPDFLEEYSENGNKVIPVTILAKILFKNEAKETGQELTEKEQELIVNLLSERNAKMYHSQDEEIEKFFKNSVQKELEEILQLESIEDIEAKILDSIFFSDGEKKAINKIIESKSDFFSNIPFYVRVEKAIKENIKPGKYVSERRGIFEKRYKLHPLDIHLYIKTIIKEVAEKIEQQFYLKTSTQEDNEIEEKLQLLQLIAERYPEIYTFKKDGKELKTPTKKQIAKNLSLKVLNTILKNEEDQLENIKIVPFFKKLDGENVEYDKYILLAYLKMLIKYSRVNSLNFLIDKVEDLDPYVKALILKRFENIQKKLSTYSIESRKKIYDKLNFNSFTKNRIEKEIYNLKQNKKVGERKVLEEKVSDKKPEEKNFLKCPECNSTSLWKNGVYKEKQRYKCKNCKKSFTSWTFLNFHKILFKKEELPCFLTKLF